MSFSDQPPPSLLRARPLLQMGRFMTRLIHGKRRSPEGLLLTRKHFMSADVEWRLGQSYLGMLGLLSVPLTIKYVKLFHNDVGYYRYYYSFGRRVAEHHLGFWTTLPTDLKIIVPLTFGLHIVGMISAIRLMLVRQELRPLADLDD